MFQLLHGDCRAMLKTLPDCSVDSVVTDPPYELGFMGKGWDKSGIANSVELWTEVLRVLKPGGHLLAFSGSRTYHRMVCAIEDAGFEVRDQIMWVYGSGFPKSLDVSKAVDKAAGAKREVIGKMKNPASTNRVLTMGRPEHSGSGWNEAPDITIPATDAARQWQGWGTALKPAHEPIVVARKPLIGTVAANVLAHGTGALNVDGCRVPLGDDKPFSYPNGRGGQGWHGRESLGTNLDVPLEGNAAGRWPANLIHDGSDEVVALFPDSNGSGGSVPNVKVSGYGDGVVGTGKSEYFGGERTKVDAGSGSAARFFYCAKASKRDRNEGCEHIAAKQYSHDGREKPTDNAYQRNSSSNSHPTVKPTDLMRYLCRLITPPGGLVLDPFTGSGSTGKAAMLEGFRFVGCELSEEYIAIAKARIETALGADLC